MRHKWKSAETVETRLLELHIVKLFKHGLKTIVYYGLEDTRQSWTFFFLNKVGNCNKNYIIDL